METILLVLMLVACLASVAFAGELAVFIDNGDTEDYTPSGAVAAGDVIVIGTKVFIAKSPIPANIPGTLAGHGRFDVPKATGTGSAIAEGVAVYWHAGSPGVANVTSSGGVLMGHAAIGGASDDDETVRINLNDGV